MPLFALANAGILINTHLLARAVKAPITVGIVAAYVLGKPVAFFGTSWLLARASRGALRP